MKKNKIARQELLCRCESELQFSIPLPDEIPPNLTVNCPYCDKQMMVDFEAASAEKNILRSGNNIIEKESLPDLIKTKPLEGRCCINNGIYLE